MRPMLGTLKEQLWPELYNYKYSNTLSFNNREVYFLKEFLFFKKEA